ncbi:MAG TPA: bifunctional DNA-formamidopyrimidine glycosylase/DNA-(apurinic or apyrimidinic site) lyase, partial [Mycobacteriales bacterium]|nr:bifunctional DNA-formamidopyrimidine glycosylase/DNA-(apurinic or apyrimidinic site) lyase [Mycobacteriales bacterium]
MPELPEVEVVRRGLERWVAGRTVAKAEMLHPRATRRHVAGPDDVVARLTGRTLSSVERRGKYLWLPLSGADEALLGHLGMSGQLLVLPPETPDGPHLRARLAFTDGGRELRYVDQRTFGGLSVEPTVDGVPAVIAHIGRDPLDPDFDLAAFTAALRQRKTGIKRALLDQSLVSGIGNIYADEALWRAKLHWARPTETMTAPVVATLIQGVRDVMGEALSAGGTSFDSLYVDVNGESGYFGRSLDVYGRRDEPCRRCGTPIRRDPFMNRSSYTCPRCQPRPRRG